MTHTKGQWSLQKGMESFNISTDTKREDEGFSICKTWGDNQVDEANAKLIAAAPELLAQVKNARDTIFKAGGHVRRLNISQYAELYDLLSQAITKATE